MYRSTSSKYVAKSYTKLFSSRPSKALYLIILLFLTLLRRLSIEFLRSKRVFSTMTSFILMSSSSDMLILIGTSTYDIFQLLFYRWNIKTKIVSFTLLQLQFVPFEQQSHFLHGCFSIPVYHPLVCFLVLLPGFMKLFFSLLKMVDQVSQSFIFIT